MSHDTCKAHLTKKEYLNGCKSYKPHRLSTNPLSYSGNIDRAYVLDYMKNVLEGNGFINYLKHPEEFMQPYSEDLQCEEEIFKPKKLHAEWLTNVNSPRLKNFIDQATKLPGYDKIIWTNLPKDIFINLHPQLMDTDIYVKNIEEIATDHRRLLDIVTNPGKHLTNIFDVFLIDLTKYLIIESEGGIFTDFNFHFGKNFTLENIKCYSFIAPYLADLPIIENGFFISKAHHIIFRELLDTVEHMMFSNDCALHQLRKAVVLTGATEIYSMFPLAMSGGMNNNQNGNIDVLTRGTYIVPLHCSSCENKNLSSGTLEKIQDHTKLEDSISSGNLEQIGMFGQSYMRLKNYIEKDYSGCLFHCIENELIGKDGLEASWNNANLFDQE